MKVAIYKAQPITGTDVIPDLEIVATLAVPNDRRDDELDVQGQAIAEALWTSLPGGTLDAVLRALLERRASTLVVRFPA